VGWSLLFN